MNVPQSLYPRRKRVAIIINGVAQQPDQRGRFFIGQITFWRALNSGSHKTLRWRGVDSNFWFRNSHHAPQDRPC
jgi:hypothetical protein